MTARKKQPLTARLGKLVGKYGPGAGKKLGRVAKTVATKTAAYSRDFGKGVKAGWREA